MYKTCWTRIWFVGRREKRETMEKREGEKMGKQWQTASDVLMFSNKKKFHDKTNKRKKY